MRYVNMRIVKESTRLIFYDYNDIEKKKIEDIVGTEEKVFTYEDPDGKFIAYPPGMLKDVMQTFPNISVVDNSSKHWDCAPIQPVNHNAQPRNQLQIDFINFVLENAKKNQNVAGILSTGTGKAEPINSRIPTPNGYKLMGDIKVGDHVIGSNGKPIKVTRVFPQGVKDIYRIRLIDGRFTLCTAEHLWKIINMHTGELEVIELCRLMRRHYREYGIPVGIPPKYTQIDSIEFSHRDEAQCIMVDNWDHLYMTNNEIITHNTFMACYCAIKVGLRTLIITPTSSIKAQWGETLTGMFHVDPSKVLVVNSPKQFFNVTADFVIVSQASLASINKTYDLEKIMKANKFGVKVIDEVQMWFHNIIKVDANTNIPNNWYITGTFGRSGAEENNLYQKMFGNLQIFREKQKKPTIFDRRPGNIYGMKPHTITKMVWAHSGISHEELQAVNNSIRYSERSEKWVRYGINVPAYMKIVLPEDGTITKFLSTILKVIQNAEKEVTYGKTLILGNTIANAMVVMSYCQKMFPDKKIGTIHSRQSKAENDKAKAESDIIVSTISSCGTGFDWKGLAKLITFAQYQSWILADQISGRLRVRDDGLETYMWDIVDADVKQLRAWANSRADVERRKSKTFKVIDG